MRIFELGVEILESSKLFPTPIVKIVGEPFRGLPSEDAKAGKLGVMIEIKTSDFGTKTTVLHASLCEDMMQFGSMIADEFLYWLFEDEWKILLKNFNKK